MTTIFEFLSKDPEPLSFRAGETIFAQGQLGEEMYVIGEGEVDIVFKEKVINTHGAGEIFGEMALIDNQSRSASAVAKSDCKIAPVSEKRFIFLVQEHPYFSLQVMRVLAERLRKRTES